MPAATAARRTSNTPVSQGLWLILFLASPCGLLAGDREALKADAEQFFRDRVTPFVKTYCIPCHQNARPTRAGVNFSPALKAPGHAAFTEQWKKADARVKAHDMPPKGAPQPSEADRRMFAGDWPVCTLRASFRQWVDALKEIVRGMNMSLADQKKLFHDNAVKFYALKDKGYKA